MVIENATLLGLAFGFVVGIVITKPKLGCAALLLVPIAMIAYISAWQQQNPELIRSTSGLDFLFVPFWPSVGALCGFTAGLVLRTLDEEK